MKKKYGPFPLFVWLILGVAAFYLYNKFKTNQSIGTTGGGVAGRGTKQPHGHRNATPPGTPMP